MSAAASPLRRILLVEDDPDITTVTRLALQVLGGFEVACCATGAEALARAVDAPPDLILLDVMMPDMDGPETLVRLRALPVAAAVPVVFLTARVQAPEVARYLELGAAAVLSKPFDPLTLSDTLRDIWSGLHGSA